MSALHTADNETDSDHTDRSGRYPRRTILGAVGGGIAALAGCTADAAPSADGTTLLDTTAEVDPGRYDSFRFELPGERWVTTEAALSDRSLDVKRDGPGVDVVVMTAGAFARFSDGGPFEFRPTVSMPDVVNGSVSGTLPAGEYVLVVDNSDVGDGSPDGSDVPAVVDLSITAASGRQRARAGGRPGGR